MLLLGALFAVFVAGFWLYCLVDVALAPSDECRRLPKAAWTAVVAGIPVIGAVTWLAARDSAQLAGVSRPHDSGAPGPGPSPGSPREHQDGDQDQGRGRPGNEPGRPSGPGPAGVDPVDPVGPDDDPEFLRLLDRAIHHADVGDDPAAS
jgi:Phospholipase_D-nuclease N-terminal